MKSLSRAAGRVEVPSEASAARTGGLGAVGGLSAIHKKTAAVCFGLRVSPGSLRNEPLQPISAPRDSLATQLRRASARPLKRSASTPSRLIEIARVARRTLAKHREELRRPGELLFAILLYRRQRRPLPRLLDGRAQPPRRTTPSHPPPLTNISKN